MLTVTHASLDSDACVIVVGMSWRESLSISGLFDLARGLLLQARHPA